MKIFSICTYFLLVRCYTQVLPIPLASLVRSLAYYILRFVLWSSFSYLHCNLPFYAALHLAKISKKVENLKESGAPRAGPS